MFCQFLRNVGRLVWQTRSEDAGRPRHLLQDAFIADMVSSDVQKVKVCVVSGLSGEVVTEFAIPRMGTVRHVRERVGVRHGAGLPPGRLQLLLEGRVLADEVVLGDVVLGEATLVTLQLVRLQLRQHTFRYTYDDNAGDVQFNFMIIGNSGVGKTGLVTRYAMNFFEPSEPTIGGDCRLVNLHVDGTTHVKLKLWDMGGAQQYARARSMYFKEVYGVLVVYDVTNRDSFDSLSDWLCQISEHTTAVGLPELVVCIVGTKVDLVDSRQVSESEASEFAEGLGLKYFETMATSGRSAHMPFEYITGWLLDR